MAFTPYGVMEKGTILTDAKLPKEFLIHLVEEAGAAEYMEKDSYKTKVIEVEAVKKPLSSQSLPQAKVSRKKTSKKRTKKQK